MLTQIKAAEAAGKVVRSVGQSGDFLVTTFEDDTFVCFRASLSYGESVELDETTWDIGVWAYEASQTGVITKEEYAAMREQANKAYLQAEAKREKALLAKLKQKYGEA